MNIYTAHGSHGSIQFNSDTGRVIDGETCDCTGCNQQGYSDIARIDVIELHEWYRDNPHVKMDDEFDILELGYWTHDGQYVAPDVLHRGMLARHAGVVVLP